MGVDVIALFDIRIAMLDEKPLVSLGAGAAGMGFYEDEFALEFAAFQRELEVTFIEQGFGGFLHFGARVFAGRHERGPGPGVPDFDGAATVIAFGDGALKIEIADG